MCPPKPALTVLLNVPLAAVIVQGIKSLSKGHTDWYCSSDLFPTSGLSLSQLPDLLHTATLSLAEILLETFSAVGLLLRVPP